jgi:signal transduction histidine kinase
MRERVALAGGDIVIASKTGTGTEIAVSFPLQRGE